MQERNIRRIDAFTYREWIANSEIGAILIPVGSTEQHGPAMPLGTDEYLSTKMAELAADQVDALVGPTIQFGYKSQQRSGGGNHLGGTFGFDGATVIAIVRNIIREVVRHGFKRVVFVNGHYENYQFLYEGAELALSDLRAEAPDVQVMLLSYWDFVSPDVIDRLYPEGFPGWDVEHGGVMETSLMLRYFPELVDMSRVIDHPPAVLPLYDLLPVDPSLTPDSGCLSAGGSSTAEKGEILSASIVSGMANAILERFGPMK